MIHIPEHLRPYLNAIHESREASNGLADSWEIDPKTELPNAVLRSLKALKKVVYDQESKVVTIEELIRAERSAAGHCDYAIKLALNVFDLAVSDISERAVRVRSGL